MKKWTISIVTVLSISAAIIISATSSGKYKSQPEEEYIADAEPVRLNEILTDSTSVPIKGIDSRVEAFMKKWEIKGASLAVMRNDSLVYVKGYGFSDCEEGKPMLPGNILRMASVSKLITATGIMHLQEEGLLSLQDTVFGNNGILDDAVFTDAVKDKRIFNITVEHLLRHQGGFTCGLGDPMFSTRDIIRHFHLDTVPDSRTLTKCVLSRRLGFAPGTSQSYSNFGYLLLSMIIEKITGEDYKSYMTENILNKAGCYDFHIARNRYEERYDNEVRYYMQKDAEKCEAFDMSGEMVERCYGGSNIEGLYGAGAWCGSPAELCRFVASIDGKPEIPDIISAESVAAMTEYFDKDTFSLGWNDTKPDGEWTRTGTLAGSSALVKCYPDGECWIIITNTGTYIGPHLARHTSELLKKCRETQSASLPSVNLFE